MIPKTSPELNIPLNNAKFVFGITGKFIGKYPQVSCITQSMGNHYSNNR